MSVVCVDCACSKSTAHAPLLASKRIDSFGQSLWIQSPVSFG